jgi:hypothetical protein
MRSSLLAVALFAAAATAQTQQPAPPPAGPRLAVYPPDINLETARDRQSFLVQLAQPDGITRDVTAEAAVAKLMIALGRAEGPRIEAARAAFAAPWAGES